MNCTVGYHEALSRAHAPTGHESPSPRPPTLDLMRVYTIGHSTRSLDELVAALRSFEVDLLADIRTVPRSRHTPQFNADRLSAELPERGIAYLHLGRLGGLRHTRKDSPNTGWHNASFRGYADHMQTDEFAAGVDELLAAAEGRTPAVMCAEAVPWRCHRSMVGDALLVRGHEVFDIFEEGKARPKRLTGFAEVDGHRLTYPGESDHSSSSTN